MLIELLIVLWLLGEDKKPPVKEAIDRVKNQEYTSEHACLEFSRDLVEELRKEGIQAEIIIGESPETEQDDNVRHAWVGIWVEPQTGEFTKGYHR